MTTLVIGSALSIITLGALGFWYVLYDFELPTSIGEGFTMFVFCYLSSLMAAMILCISLIVCCVCTKFIYARIYSWISAYAWCVREKIGGYPPPGQMEII